MLGSNLWCLTSTLKLLGQRTSAIMQGLLNRVLQQLCKKKQKNPDILSFQCDVYTGKFLVAKFLFFIFTIDKVLLSITSDHFYLVLAQYEVCLLHPEASILNLLV